MPKNSLPRLKMMLLMAAAFVGGGALMHLRAAAPPVAAPKDEPQTIMQLAVARYQTADRGYQYAVAGHKSGDAPGYDALDWLRRKLKARLEIAEPKADRVAFIRECIEQLKSQEAFEERMVKAQLSGNEELLRVRYDRLDAEILLKQIEAK